MQNRSTKTMKTAIVTTIILVTLTGCTGHNQIDLPPGFELTYGSSFVYSNNDSGVSIGSGLSGQTTGQTNTYTPQPLPGMSNLPNGACSDNPMYGGGNPCQ